MSTFRRYVVKLCSPPAQDWMGPQRAAAPACGMLSNLAPHRRKTGWGRSGQRRQRAIDPTGFTPVVNEFGDIDRMGPQRVAAPA